LILRFKIDITAMDLFYFSFNKRTKRKGKKRVGLPYNA
jgi:hypothetical protein